MKKNENQKKSFESSLASLETIVSNLERGDLALEESLKLFEDGIRLARECQDRLNQAERRIELLMRDNEGRPAVSDFEGGGGGSDTAGSETDVDENVF
jgi:exodeoxyribonuclease VII small subunit